MGVIVSKGAAISTTTFAKALLLIVKLLLLIVRESLVRVLNLLKLLASRLIWIEIGVILLCQGKIRQFDVFVGCIRLQTQCL